MNIESQNQNTKVSIILAVYNGKAVVESTLKSIFNQDYRNYEVIAIDDGSTDDSISLLKEYEKKHSEKMKIIQQSNAGVSAARNVGIKYARGEYIAFLDQDDVWETNKIKKQVTILDNTNDFSFVFCNFYRFKHADGKRFEKTNTDINSFILKLPHKNYTKADNVYLYDSKNTMEFLLKGYPIYPSTMMLRKNILEKVGMWNPLFPRCQDFDLSIRCSKYSGFCYIDEVLVGVGRHGKNVSNSALEQSKEDTDVLRYHLKGSFFNKEEKNKIRYYLGKRICGIAYNYIHEQEYRIAKKYYLNALLFPNFIFHAFFRLLILLLPNKLIKKIYK
ncbi:MAG: glycosyltransferase [Fibrobacter sp.]|nr:glycosyltransferase [Fibrobacter sp.]